MKDLVFKDNDITITSLELVKIINQFREIEGKKELEHKILMRKIRTEIEALEGLGINGQYNFVPSSYINTQNKEQPCYNINRDGMLMLLNSESTLVRYKTAEYIKNLENAYHDIQFRIGDKEHQKKCMALIHDILPEEEKKNKINHIKANTVVNKLVSDLYGYEKMVKKPQMNTDMLKDREMMLEDYSKLFAVVHDNHEVNEILNKKYKKTFQKVLTM